VCCSKSLSKDFQRLFNINYRYIQNGVNTEKYNTVSEEIKNKIRVELNLSVYKNIYISVGSLIPEKNTGLIIELFKNWNYLKDSMLIVLGEGNEYNKYKKSVINCDNIRLLGNIQDVRKYLQSSDFFISASKGEGLPNAVLEAMSVGLPCILSNIIPHQELISDNRFGVIYNNNLDNLKEKILGINNMDYNYLSENCRKRILKHFSARKMSLNYQQLYSEILNTYSHK